MSLRTVSCAIALVALALGALLSCSDNPTAPNLEQGPWQAWSNPAPPQQFSYALTSIWGTGADDVYAVGGQGIVLHYDGQEWKFLRLGGGEQLNDIWGDATGNLYVVGRGGTILHYDGSRWKSMESGTTADLWAVWGAPGYGAFAVGSDGVVLHYNGATWNSIDTGIHTTLRDVSGDGRLAFAVGDAGTILRLTYDSARQLESHTTNDLRGIGGGHESGICAVGAAGTILRYENSEWKPERSYTMVDLKKVCGTTDGHLVAIGGYTVLSSDDGAWNYFNLRDALDTYSYPGLLGVWGASIHDVFLLMSDSVVHSDGASMSAMDLAQFPIPDPDQTWGSFADIWGSSGDCVYAVGKPEGVFKYDGTDWILIGGKPYTHRGVGRV